MMIEVISYGRPGRAAAAPGLAARDQSRVDWVDVAKGICIILVVTMHATLGVEAEMGREGFMHEVVAFTKPFRLAGLFLVSGLFLSRVIDRDWRDYADKRVLHFAYFYVLWLLIQSAFKFGHVGDGSLPGFARHVVVGLVEPFSTLWFIYLLAVMSVVTKVLRGVSSTVVLAAAAALQIMPVETGSLVLNEFCERWVYFVAGFVFAPRVLRFAEWAARHGGLALAGLTAWALVNGALALIPSGSGGRATLAEAPMLSLACGMAGALAMAAVASLLASRGVAGAMRYVGSHSIAVYLTFFLPMALTRTALIKTGIIDDAGTVAAIVTAAAVIGPLILERLARGTRLSFLYERPDWARLRPARPRLRMQPAE